MGEIYDGFASEGFFTKTISTDNLATGIYYFWILTVALAMRMFVLACANRLLITHKIALGDIYFVFLENCVIQT